MRYGVVWLALGLFAVAPPRAHAQETPLSEVLVRLIQADIRLAGPPPGSVFPSHEAHFVPGADARLTPYLFNQAILSQLSTFPLGSSSGGLSYTFDPALGTYSRASTSFGPLFAERALTIGRGRWTVGTNYQHAAFSSFEGKDLDEGDIRFYLTHTSTGGAFFEGDLIETALSMKLKEDTVAMFATYGLMDRLDVGIAVPVVHVSLDATVNAKVLRLATLDTGPTSTIHTFDGGANTATYADSRTATGLGDILVRAKYRFFDWAGGALAAAVDIRTPTGDDENLLGTGTTQAKFLLIGSGGPERFSPHFNIGFTASGESPNAFVNVTDEFNYTGGVEVAASAKVTITGDIVGRQLRGSGRLVERPKTYNWMTSSGVTGSSTFSEFAPESGNLSLVFGTIGVKINPIQNLLISGSVLLPFTDAGMRSNPVPVVGFEYSF